MTSCYSFFFLQKDRRRKLLLKVTFGLTLTFSLLWVVALATDHWARLVFPDGGVTVVLDGGQRVMLTRLYMGLWRFCRTEWSNRTEMADYNSSSSAVDAATFDSELIKSKTLHIHKHYGCI